MITKDSTIHMYTFHIGSIISYHNGTICISEHWALSNKKSEAETTVMSAMSTERQKASPVWEYFDETSNNSVCKIENSEKVECGKKMKGKNPTNLK